MKITWWGWIIILVVAYWWLKKKGYLKGRILDSAPFNQPCAQTEGHTCQKCYECLINPAHMQTKSSNTGFAPQPVHLPYEAEQQCRDWNCEGEFNFPD